MLQQCNSGLDGSNQQSDLNMEIRVPLSNRLKHKTLENNQEIVANSHWTKVLGGFPGVLRKDGGRSLLVSEVKKKSRMTTFSSAVGGGGQLLSSARSKHESSTSSKAQLALKSGFKSERLKEEKKAALDSFRGQGNMISTLKHLTIENQGKQQALGSQKLEAREEIEVPTEVQIELKHLVGQQAQSPKLETRDRFTEVENKLNQLVEKQAQVVALFSEILFGIQEVSRLIDESKPMTESRDVESGRSLSDRGSVIHQLLSIFLAAVAFLRKFWPLILFLCVLLLAGFYLCLPFQFIGHSQASNRISSVTVVVSLQNIHNSSGEVFVCMGCAS